MNEQIASWFEGLIPEIKKSGDPRGTIIKFAEEKNLAPALMERLGYIYNTAKTINYLDKSAAADRGQSFAILDVEDMIGKWNDILIHGNFTKKEDGFFKVWVNNELKYEYNGRTTSGKPSYFKFGIYQTYVSRYSPYESKPYPTQIVFFDEIRHGNSRESVVKNLY